MKNTKDAASVFSGVSSFQVSFKHLSENDIACKTCKNQKEKSERHINGWNKSCHVTPDVIVILSCSEQMLFLFVEPESQKILMGSKGDKSSIYVLFW